jgi:hypothetical protein
MAVKGKHRRLGVKTRKSTLRHRTLRNKKLTHGKTYRSKTNRRRYCMRGGNYEKDFTTRTFEGTATKPLNKFVVAAPGIGVLSGSAYLRLMEARDRNGNDVYD